MADVTPSKRCSNPRCPETNPQPLTAFSRNRVQRDGYQNECKTCSAERGRASVKTKSAYDRQRYTCDRKPVLRQRNLYCAQLAAIVFNHYGWQCACLGCNDPDLTIDHIDGNGQRHREELYGDPRRGSTAFYRWLIANGFPDGYQTLCRGCNSSKRARTHCRLAFHK